MHIRLSLTVLLVSVVFSLSAQDNHIDDLRFFADVMTNASDHEHRLFAQDQFQRILKSELGNENSFSFSMERVPWVFAKYDPDSTFRIISWQVEVEKDRFTYQSVYQNAQGDLDFFINQENVELDDRTAFTKENMYPAIYYDIHQYEDYYLLSGYRKLTGGITQKITEVLTINNDIPSFGSSIFYTKEDTPKGRGKKRMIMNYSSVAQANININIADGIIVYDHIIAIPDKGSKSGVLLVPDGSYQAFEFKSANRWLFNEKLYTDIQATPLNQPLKRSERSENIKNRKP